MMVDPTARSNSHYSQQAATASPQSQSQSPGATGTSHNGNSYSPLHYDDASSNSNRNTGGYSGRGGGSGGVAVQQNDYTHSNRQSGMNDNNSNYSNNYTQDSQPIRYSALHPPSMAQRMSSATSPSQSSYGYEGSRVSTIGARSTAGYQPTSPMQGPRSPSLDYSQAPLSPLPPYVARPPPVMQQPPTYYQEVRNETQAANQIHYMEMDDRIGHQGSNSRSRNNEEDIYQSAGQFNPEGNRGMWSSKRNMGEDGEEIKEDQEVVRELVLQGLAERWGQEFDPSYNQDLQDIHAYYVERHRATVVVLLEHTDAASDDPSTSNTLIAGCGILLPLPAEDVYGSWCEEPPSRAEVLNGLRLCRMLRLSVTKSCRGKGYSRKIISHLAGAAREQGYDRILVETETLWTSAVHVYKSAGFEVVEEGEVVVHLEYRL
ncbi:hypothetical protein BGZ99_001984 [Dissophora globulifera]|uniref:N-acetyltransferase domain-containing protein n=1 Tax=Dissophora globulifera TaxID=979702 RepID=A0A9P6RP34_9FUNG|nr:hypothetical protein BGZ99_001984 [Dissophora globulifera]